MKAHGKPTPMHLYDALLFKTEETIKNLTLSELQACMMGLSLDPLVFPYWIKQDGNNDHQALLAGKVLRNHFRTDVTEATNHRNASKI